jgi:hypothetical protein
MLKHKICFINRKKCSFSTCNMAHWQCAPASEGDLRNFPEYATPKVECNDALNLEFTTCEPEEPLTCKVYVFIFTIIIIFGII